MITRIVQFLLILGALSGSATAQERPTDFGRQWVRSHPFTTMALTLRPAAVRDDKYKQANLNTFLVWRHRREDLFESAVRQGLPWHCHLMDRVDGQKGLTPLLKEEFSALLQEYPGGAGVLVWDEPQNTKELRAVAETVAWIRQNHPEILVYSNLDRQDVKFYQQYVDIVKPDVLVCGSYPFRIKPQPGGISTHDFLQEYHFPFLADIRQTAINADIPYWFFVQAFGEGDWRVPSESELRMQVYTLLAYGYTGLLYFTYDHYGGGLINFSKRSNDPDDTGTITHNYHETKEINAEIIHIGRPLRFLTSTDIRYVPGRHHQNGQLRRNPTPDGLNYFRRDTKRYPTDVKDIVIDSVGPGKDGLIGYFKDDTGAFYFMLVNLWCREDASAQDCRITMTITLAPSVTKLSMLSRETGAVEHLPIKDGTVRVTLPGGTGELFKIGDGEFPGLGQKE